MFDGQKAIPIMRYHEKHDVTDCLGWLRITAEMEAEIANGWRNGIRYELIGSYHNEGILTFNIIGIANNRYPIGEDEEDV